MIRLGTKRFGPPSKDHEARVMTTALAETLDDLADRVLTASDWDDLLDTPR